MMRKKVYFVDKETEGSRGEQIWEDGALLRVHMQLGFQTFITMTFSDSNFHKKPQRTWNENSLKSL